MADVVTIVTTPRPSWNPNPAPKMGPRYRDIHSSFDLSMDGGQPQAPPTQIHGEAHDGERRQEHESGDDAGAPEPWERRSHRAPPPSSAPAIVDDAM